MDWGTSNRYGYLATSLPLRMRLGMSLGPAVVWAVAAAWFGSVSWAGAIVTFALGTALHVVLAPVADLAAWRPLDGVCVAALAGAGSGAILVGGRPA